MSKHPVLGARIKANGYMVRHSTPFPSPDPLARWNNRISVTGWKRKESPVEGIFYGVRRLQIGYWQFEIMGEDEYRPYRIAGYVNVYAIAINRRAVRYVLPRDVEVSER